MLVILCALLGSAALAWLVTWRREGHPDRIVVLLYHRLFDPATYEALPPLARNFALTTARFREHLERLRASGHTPVSPDDVVAALDGKKLPPRPVLVTFDDGCESVYAQALPLLRELGFPAALFVTADPGAWIFRDSPDAQRRVTDEEIRALDAGDVLIGSHALTHDPLQTMSVPEIEHELGHSKRELERALGGKPVRDFAVPLNWYGDKVRAAAQKLGYRAVWTSDTGTVRPGSDPFHLRRLNVEGWMSGDDLLRAIAPAAIVQRRVIAFAKRFPARLIGPRIWLPFRRWLFASPLGPMLTLRGLRRMLLAGMAVAVAAAALLALRAA